MTATSELEAYEEFAIHSTDFRQFELYLNVTGLDVRRLSGTSNRLTDNITLDGGRRKQLPIPYAQGTLTIALRDSR